MVKKTHKTVPDVEYRPQHEPTAGVEICELESIFSRSPKLDVDPFSPHRVQFHHLVYVADGASTHFIDFIRHPCPAGSFLFINKNQIHAFDKHNRPAGLVILFTQGFLDSILSTMRVPTFAFGFDLLSDAPVQTVDGELRTTCDALLTEIRKVTGKDPYDRLVIQLLLASLLLKLRHDRGESDNVRLSDEKRQRFCRFMSLIEQRFHTTKDGAAYARMMGISYKTLSEVCKAGAQRTPKQLIDAYTVLEAKRRLAIDEVQVTQLAFDLGFNEVTNFVKFFKKHTQDTPNQFQLSISR